MIKRAPGFKPENGDWEFMVTGWPRNQSRRAGQAGSCQACHHGPGAWLGRHVDLEDKLLTQIFYFNDSWNEADGGNLTIVASGKLSDAAATILPVVGNSVLVVRSDNSWHAVAPVVANCQQSRRSLAVNCYRPVSVSTMWPPGDKTPLHDYVEGRNGSNAKPGLWKRLLG